MADIKDIKLGNTKYNIKIPSSRVKSMTDYTKPSSKPSPEAIQQSDTLNAALGKLEYKADVNQTNILSLIKQSTYTTSTTNTSISNLLYNAAKAVGISDPAADTKSFFASIFTETINECLFLYGVYKHGVLGYAVSTANKDITLNAINNLGTVGWTGGTAPYYVQVRFF